MFVGDLMLCLNGLNISLDRREHGSDIDFISHAHSDHTSAAKASKHVLTSDQTIQLIEQVYSANVENVHESTGIELLESGHMLGSRQLCIEDNELGARFVYTGDFQMQKSKAAKPIEIKDSDYLIMDSTYPDPAMVFEEKGEIEAEMQDWAARMLEKGIVLFSVYAMGKAQELIVLLNETGMKPIVSKKISGINKVYEKNGVALEYASAYDGQSDFDEMVRGDFVGITECRNINGLASALAKVHNRMVFTAVATGFAKIFRFGTDMQFPLSDHADFRQGVEYIDAAGAKMVFTYGHGSEEFAANLRKKGYRSWPFSDYGRARQQMRTSPMAKHK